MIRVLETRSLTRFPIPSGSGSQLECLSLRGLNPLNGESPESLKVLIPCSEIFPGGIPIERVEKVVVLNSKDVWPLHIDAVEVNLWDVSLNSEWDGWVAMKIVRGGSSDVSR